jgi:hypothetical protein
MYIGSGVQFGDGKPIILFPELGSSLPFLFLSNWLRMLGYRPATIDYSSNFDELAASESIRGISQRIGRKVVLVAPISAMTLVTRLAQAHGRWVSDIVVLNASQQTKMPHDVRAHFISSGGFSFAAMAALPPVLRNIGIELIEASSSGEVVSRPPSRAGHRLSAKEQQR